MLGRRGWFDAVTKRFDAGKKGVIRCCDKNNCSRDIFLVAGGPVELCM
jgi:hypothetical protein